MTIVPPFFSLFLAILYRANPSVALYLYTYNLHAPLYSLFMLLGIQWTCPNSGSATTPRRTERIAQIRWFLRTSKVIASYEEVWCEDSAAPLFRWRKASPERSNGSKNVCAKNRLIYGANWWLLDCWKCELCGMKIKTLVHFVLST